MKKALAAVAIVAAALVAVSAPAGAAPPIEKLPKNAFVIPITCEGVNDGEPFLIWGSNVKGNVNGNAGLVGHPLGVDVPVGVQKTERQGAAFDRAIPCSTPIGTVYVLPTGKPA